MSNLELGPDIFIKNKVHDHHVYHDLITSLTDKIKMIHEVSTLRNDPELILLVCNLVENKVKKKKGKQQIDKKDIVIKILQHVFDLQDEEINATKKVVDFLHVNGKIRKVKFVKRCWSGVKDWIKRKFL